MERSREQASTKRHGCQSIVEPLRRVLLKRPEPAFAVADPARWHYTSRPDLDAAQREHDALADLLRNAGAEVVSHDEPQPDCADAIFVFDPALITDRGAIMLKMGKALRRGEEAAMARRFEALGIPITTALHGEAQAEGGDSLWLDHRTLAVGLGFRTNAEGLRQLREALEIEGISAVAAWRPLPAPALAAEPRRSRLAGRLPTVAVGALLAAPPASRHPGD